MKRSLLLFTILTTMSLLFNGYTVRTFPPDQSDNPPVIEPEYEQIGVTLVEIKF